MKKLHGVISDKLRKNFTADEILHNPRTTATTPMPKTGVEGIPLTGRGQKPKKGKP